MKTIEARAVISAADKTGNVFDKIAAKFKGIEKTAKALEGVKAPKFSGDMMEELKRLGLAEKQLQKVRDQVRSFDRDLRAQRPSFSQFARAHQDFANKTVSHWRQVKVATDDARDAQQKFMRGGGPGAAAKSAAPWLGVGAAGYYAGRAGRFAFEKSKEANRETTKQREAGLTQKQSDAIAGEAEGLSKKYPTLSQTEFRSAGREATLQMGDAGAGLRMMPVLGQFMTKGKLLWGKEQIEEQTRKALQVLDARQITDPGRASGLLNAMLKASQVEGGPDYKASDLRVALKRGGIMTQGQSDRFVASVLPQMGVDLGYETAGEGLMSAHSALIGGRQKKEAAAFQTKVGMRDKNGQLVGKEKFLRNVDKWVDEDLIPIMQKEKVDINDPAAVGEFLGKALTRSPAKALTNLVTGQQQRIKRDEQQKLAKDMDNAENLHKQDVGSALEAVSKQLENVASSAKLAEPSIAGLNKAMDLIQLAGQKMNEPGGWLDQGKKKLEAETRDAQAVGGVIKSVFDKDKEISDAGRNWIDRNTPFGRGTPNQSARAGYKTAGDAAGWGSSATPVPFAPGSGISGTFSPAGQSWSDFFSPGSSRLGRKRFVPPNFAAPGLNEAITYGTGVSGAGGQVTATLTGSADVKGEATLTVKIEAPELIRAYHDAQKAVALAGQLSADARANGPGSAGRSSPDAAAPSLRGNAGSSGPL